MNRNDLRSPPVINEATVYCNSQLKRGYPYSTKCGKQMLPKVTLSQDSKEN